MLKFRFPSVKSPSTISCLNFGRNFKKSGNQKFSFSVHNESQLEQSSSPVLGINVFFPGARGSVEFWSPRSVKF